MEGVCLTIVKDGGAPNAAQCIRPTSKSVIGVVDLLAFHNRNPIRRGHPPRLGRLFSRQRISRPGIRFMMSGVTQRLISLPSYWE
jgi:hypothetical protein